MLRQYPIKYYLFFCTLLYFTSNVYSQQGKNILVIDKAAENYKNGLIDLNPFLYILKDSCSSLDVAIITSGQCSTQFKTVKTSFFDTYNTNQSNYWLRFSILLKGARPEEWLLNFSDPEWTCYSRNKNGKINTSLSGLYTPISKRSLGKDYRDIPVTSILLTPGTVQTFWINIDVNPYPYTGRHKNLVKLNRKLIKPLEAPRLIHTQDFSNILILGILITVCFYHIVIFVYYQDWRFFHLAYYNFSHFLIILFYNGWLLLTFFPEKPVNYYEYFEPLLLIFSAVSVFFLLRSFFETQSAFPIWDNVLKFILSVHIFSFGSVFICRLIDQELYYKVFPYVLTPWIIFNFGANLFNIFLGVHAVKKGIRFAQIYLASFFVLVAGITIEHLFIANFISISPSTEYSPREWGAAIQCLILAFGLARSFKALQEEKYNADLKHNLELERVKRDRELNRFKNQLYDNITHEFRTPLTIIRGMTDQIPRQPTAARDAISRNSEQLLLLVNDMLELSKSEAGVPKLNMRQGDVIVFLKYLLSSLQSWADQRELKLIFEAEEEQLIMDYDRKKFQHIMFNLLSNAIKFTPTGGEVKVKLKTSEPKNPARTQYLELIVEDTGIGIPAEALPHIFERHYQVENELEYKGSGIGLALVKEMIDLHEGRIHVKSKIGEGSQFILQLPIRRETTQEKVKTIHKHPNGIGAKTLEQFTEGEINAVEHIEPSSNVILIAEDEPDIQFYLKSILESKYKLIFAKNGKEGVEKAWKHVPDIIISDIMMPGIDGYQLCNFLKRDIRSSHIPILLLSAKDNTGARIQGLKSGADAHLGKPFDEAELNARIEQLIAVSRQLRKQISQNEQKTKTITDEKLRVESSFLKQAKKVVEENLTNTDFDVNIMSEALMMSRSQLYRKLKALTNRSTTSFIRQVRLQKAFNLLRTTDMSVSEVAYQVGFNDPTYFARCFRNEFGNSPRDIREE